MSAVHRGPAPHLFKLLSHEIRWNILTLLARGDYNGQELVHELGHPQNLISYHLRLLSLGKVVTERRNSADERSLYYSLDLTAMRSLYHDSGEALHPALSTRFSAELALEEVLSEMPKPAVRVLFLCTRNSARSQMAEGILRSLSGGQVEVASAGSHPSQLHPLAIGACAAHGIDISQHRAKHLDELAGQSFDYIVTVCDRVRETCPTWPDDPERIHWSVPDPAAVQGSDKVCLRAFQRTALELLTRIRYFLIVIMREQKTRL